MYHYGQMNGLLGTERILQRLDTYLQLQLFLPLIYAVILSYTELIGECGGCAVVAQSLELRMFTWSPHHYDGGNEKRENIACSLDKQIILNHRTKQPQITEQNNLKSPKSFSFIWSVAIKYVPLYPQ